MSSVRDILMPVLRNPEYLDNPVREAETAGWQLLIRSATGENADLVRTSDKNILQWKPGQAEKMSQYFNDLLFAPKKGDGKTDDGLGFGEVQIDWKPVYMPLLMKKVLPWFAGYTLLLVIAGRLTKRIR